MRLLTLCRPSVCSAPLQQRITPGFSLDAAKARPAEPRQQLRRVLLAMHTRERLCHAGPAAAQHSASKPQARMLLTRQVTASNNQQQSMSGSRRGQHTRNGRCSCAGSADQCCGASAAAVIDTIPFPQCECLPACTCRMHQTTWQRAAASAPSYTTPQSAWRRRFESQVSDQAHPQSPCAGALCKSRVALPKRSPARMGTGARSCTAGSGTSMRRSRMTQLVAGHLREGAMSARARAQQQVWHTALLVISLV